MLLFSTEFQTASAFTTSTSWSDVEIEEIDGGVEMTDVWSMFVSFDSIYWYLDFFWTEK
jgi:hypothetical protein